MNVNENAVFFYANALSQRIENALICLMRDNQAYVVDAKTGVFEDFFTALRHCLHCAFKHFLAFEIPRIEEKFFGQPTFGRADIRNLYRVFGIGFTTDPGRQQAHFLVRGFEHNSAAGIAE